MLANLYCFLLAIRVRAICSSLCKFIRSSHEKLVQSGIHWKFPDCGTRFFIFLSLRPIEKELKKEQRLNARGEVIHFLPITKDT